MPGSAPGRVDEGDAPGSRTSRRGASAAAPCGSPPAGPCRSCGARFSLVSRPFWWPMTITVRPAKLASPPTSASSSPKRAVAVQLDEIGRRARRCSRARAAGPGGGPACTRSQAVDRGIARFAPRARQLAVGLADYAAQATSLFRLRFDGRHRARQPPRRVGLRVGVGVRAGVAGEELGQRRPQFAARARPGRSCRARAGTRPSGSPAAASAWWSARSRAARRSRSARPARPA